MSKRKSPRKTVASPAPPVSRSQIVDAGQGGPTPPAPFRRVRPGDPLWPAEAAWDRLRRQVGGRLIKVETPLAECRRDPRGAVCREFFAQLKNPYFIHDQPGVTQTSGWVDAWTSSPSVYAVAAEKTADVVVAVNFARENHLRLVVKGGGHSYQGTSNAPDSLLVWTRGMNSIVLHDAFVASGCEGKEEPRPAVTVGAGVIWQQAYDAVTTRGGRYVQGGGCTTVGVAGLVQSGGFGSCSKNYGTAAAGLLEAEVVTADGAVRIANARTNPDLFWGVKGGGGGSLGIVTQLTLRTRELPEYFGGAFGTIKAKSDAAFRKLTGRILAFYRDHLFNRHWGEQIGFEPGNSIRISMVFQGLTGARVEAVWKPFFDWVSGSPADFTFETPASFMEVPARHFWDSAYMVKNHPEFVAPDPRPGAPEKNTFWRGDGAQAGWVIHGFHSAWLPASLLQQGRLDSLADALFRASRHWDVALHFNKGLAGAPAEVIAAARETAMNPAVLDAFALALIGTGGPPAFPGVPGHEPDVATARLDARKINEAMGELLKVAPNPGSYDSESDFFERDWRQSFWGANYPRLAAIKKKYDPSGLFFVHHGVGSEEWSPDGFTRVV